MQNPSENNQNCPIDSLKYQIAVYEDAAAYKSLFFCLFPSLQHFAFAILRSRQMAEETASDVLMEVWIRRKKLMEIENLKFYLFTSVKNAALRKMKQENRSTRISLDNLETEIVSDYCNPEENLRSNELERELHQAIQQLPPRCKIIYKMAKEDKLRYAEISELLGVSIKTIDSQLSIALQKIAATIHHTRVKKS
jgi:RNA polymerase sigma-70 factor (family 1)